MSGLFSILVQASSRSWSGGQDLCMNDMGGELILEKTIKRLTELDADIIVIAPEFDRGGLDFLLDKFKRLSVFHGFDASPLARMVAATAELPPLAHVLRVNGLNFCVDLEAALEMADLAVTKDLDCVRFPEDFPALFASDVYRLSALRAAHAKSDLESKFHIHPKYHLTAKAGFQSSVYAPDATRYSDAHLQAVRAACIESIYAKRIDVDASKAISAGDSISHHYTMCVPYLKQGDHVLDFACGGGFGSRILGQHVAKVVGLDNDPEIIEVAQAAVSLPNLSFVCGDCLQADFEADSFDCVAAFEIVEHVDPHLLFAEIKRLLKAGGLCFMSTPQNSLGHIPTTPDHGKEFSLQEITRIASAYFQVVDVIGIKQGTIYEVGDPLGSNTFLVLKSA
jgi:2-polyprenyl-3-methyl-5-hydroxy-6-metoxy-1,4-benzoquinol methylase